MDKLNGFGLLPGSAGPPVFLALSLATSSKAGDGDPWAAADRKLRLSRWTRNLANAMDAMAASLASAKLNDGHLK